jgi:hypothetical protein
MTTLCSTIPVFRGHNGIGFFYRCETGRLLFGRIVLSMCVLSCIDDKCQPIGDKTIVIPDIDANYVPYDWHCVVLLYQIHRVGENDRR